MKAVITHFCIASCDLCIRAHPTQQGVSIHFSLPRANTGCFYLLSLEQLWRFCFIPSVLVHSPAVNSQGQRVMTIFPRFSGDTGSAKALDLASGRETGLLLCYQAQ